jgi:excisionase family DNA binding protein
MPCVECRKAMEPEERAVEVNRHLLARLSSGPGFLALPVPSVVVGQPSCVDSPATEPTSGIACSVEEAGRRLGCKRTMVFRLLREGRLVAAPRLGRKRMVLAESVDALLAAGGVDALEPRRRAAAPRGPRTGKGKALAAEIAKLPVE